jgi:hypothetical protein
MAFLDDVRWRRSPYCASAACVEVAVINGEIALRDSKLRDSPILRFTREEWDAFTAGVQADSFTI